MGTGAGRAAGRVTRHESGVLFLVQRIRHDAVGRGSTLKMCNSW